MQSFARLEAAAASGDTYEALLTYKSVLARKLKMKRGKHTSLASAVAELIAPAIAACRAGSKARGAVSDESDVTTIVEDIAKQVLVDLFPTEEATFTEGAVAAVVATATAMAPVCGAADLRGDLGPASALSQVAERFLESALKWGKETPAAAAPYAAVAPTVYRALGCVCLAQGDAKYAAAHQHFVNAGPNGHAGVAVVVRRWASPADVASGAAAWVVARSALLVLLRAASVKESGALSPAGQAHALLALPELQMNSDAVSSHPTVVFLQAFLAAAEAKDARVATACLDTWGDALKGGDPRLYDLAHRCNDAVARL